MSDIASGGFETGETVGDYPFPPCVESLDACDKREQLVDKDPVSNPDEWDTALLNGGIKHLVDTSDSPEYAAISHEIEGASVTGSESDSGPDEHDILAYEILCGTNGSTSNLGYLLPDRGVIKSIRREMSKQRDNFNA